MDPTEYNGFDRLHPMAQHILLGRGPLSLTEDQLDMLTSGHRFTPMPEDQSSIAELEKQNDRLNRENNDLSDEANDLRLKVGALEEVVKGLKSQEAHGKLWASQFLWVLKWILIGAGAMLGIMLFDLLVKWVARL